MSDAAPLLEAAPSAAARSPGEILKRFAEERPDATALVFSPAAGDEASVTWLELDRWTNRLARLLAQSGVDDSSMVVIALPNASEHIALTYAAWKLGALLLPLSHRLPAAERSRLLDLARPTVLVAEWGEPGELTRAALVDGEELSSEPLPDVVPAPGRALASGGSTGSPKIIVDPRPLLRRPLTDADPLAVLTGMRGNHVQLVSGPLYHNGPFMGAHVGLMGGQRLVVMDRFDAARVVELIERHRVSWLYLVPTMMRRILDVPGVRDADLSSLSMYHTAAHCPEDLKRTWLDLLAPERVYEGYGATEEVGLCAIRGDEWLRHPGSVGRPIDTEVKIVSEDGRECAPGEVGEVFMRRISLRETYRYLGAEPAVTDDDGFTSVGDMAYVDEEGYLYPADRRVDLVITGGSNVFPAEVEAVLYQHDAVEDVAVIGLPDPEWGHRVHAIVSLHAGAIPSEVELAAFCRERLQPYKVPKTFEFVDRLPRDAAGKLRRGLLVRERSSDG